MFFVFSLSPARHYNLWVEPETNAFPVDDPHLKILQNSASPLQNKAKQWRIGLLGHGTQGLLGGSRASQEAAPGPPPNYQDKDNLMDWERLMDCQGAQKKRAGGDPLAVKSSLGPPSASGFRKWQQGPYFPFISTNKKHKSILTIAIWGIFWAQAFFFDVWPGGLYLSLTCPKTKTRTPIFAVKLLL